MRDEIIRAIAEHLVIWITVFVIACGQCGDVKSGAKGTVLFMILFYLFFGMFIVMFYCGGHVPL